MDINQKIQFIQQIELFKDLPTPKIQIIAEATVEQNIPAKTVLIEQEDYSDLAYFICKGGVRIFRVTDDGENVNLAVAGPGEIIGEMSLLDEEPRSACVETIQNSKMLVLTRSAFLKIISEDSEVAINLLKILSKKVRETNQHIEDILSKSLTERTWKVLESLSNYFPNKTINLSQEELSGIVGATRARITETLNLLQKQGKITLSHRQIHIN